MGRRRGVRPREVPTNRHVPVFERGTVERASLALRDDEPDSRGSFSAFHLHHVIRACQSARMAKMTPAQMRAEAEERLREPGEERVRLLRRITELDQVLRPFVVEAVEVEVPYRRIQTLTGVSPNTARAWVKADAG
jgi:hypothetical protein